MAEHTPGPWTVQPCSGGYLIESPILRIVRGSGGVRTEEDARLIAAAPVLLEAARVALAELERITGDTGFEPERFRQRMEAVLVLGAAIDRADK